MASTMVKDAPATHWVSRWRNPGHVARLRTSPARPTVTSRMTESLAAWYGRFPEGWWGYHWTPPRPMSAVEIIGSGSLDARLMATLWAVVSRRRSVMLASEAPMAGKTTTLSALVDFLPTGHHRRLPAGLGPGRPLGRRDRSRFRLHAHQRDERPPADLRLGPQCARRADTGRQGLRPWRHHARRLARRGARLPSFRPWCDRCGPRRPDDLPPVQRVSDARRNVPALRRGLAPAA